MKKKSLTITIAVILLGAILGWALNRDESAEDPETVVEEQEKKDTGYTEEQREELMRTIGYVQQ